MPSTFHDWLALPMVGLAVAIVLTVIGARLTTNSANGLLVAAWVLATVSIFVLPFVAKLDTIPRILCTALFASGAGLGLYPLRWDDTSLPVGSKTEPQSTSPAVETLAPQLEIKIYPWPPDPLNPYKPPLKRYVLDIQNLNRSSVPILGLRIEFNFKHIVTDVKKEVLVRPGVDSVIEREFHQKRANGETYDEVVLPTKTGLEQKFNFEIRQAIINKDLRNLNFVDLNVEKWDEHASFAADIIVDTSKEPSSRKSPVDAFNGMYFYEINGKKFSAKVSGSIRE